MYVPHTYTPTMYNVQDTQLAIAVAKKTLDDVRSNINDQWNVAGINGGLGYGAEGLPYFTSHYGYFMSSWHLVMALSGQNANMTAKTLTFKPKLNLPYALPVILPGAWGQVEASSNTTAAGGPKNQAPLASSPSQSNNGGPILKDDDEGMSTAEEGAEAIKYTLLLNFGSLDLKLLEVGNCRYKSEGSHAVQLKPGQSVVWSC